MIHSIPGTPTRNVLKTEPTPDRPEPEPESEPPVPNGGATMSPSKEMNPLFKLNVGGKSYKFRIEIVLNCREPSLLSLLIKANHEQRLMIVDGYISETGEYYMERNSRVADHVLDYFVTGLLHKPNDVCVERFKEELDFWRLENNQIAPCCSILNEFPKLKNIEETEREFDGVSCFILNIIFEKENITQSSSKIN